MPVQPNFDWEQDDDEVVIRVTIKGFRADAIDVFISDLYVKVNAHPTYLLTLDLSHGIVLEKSTFRLDLPKIKITLPKRERGLIWETLVLDAKLTPAQELTDRRAASLSRAETLYNMKLDTRERQKEVEKKRMFSEQWELEKAQRRDIEARVAQEKANVAHGLEVFETEMRTKALQRAANPAQLATAAMGAVTSGALFDASTGGVGVRTTVTKTVPIDFTPKLTAMPQRSRGDEEYYRRSRYKPVSVTDAPMFWKDKADTLYKQRNWKGACDALSESIKRDGSFLNCVANRAACWLHMHEYVKCIEDCDLAINMLQNTPAADTTQDRYKYMLAKLHVRRGAAYAWNDQLLEARDEYRVAVAYVGSDDVGLRDEIVRDLDAIEIAMTHEQQGDEQRDPASSGSSVVVPGRSSRYSDEELRVVEASRRYMHGNYAGAVEEYRTALTINPFCVKARNNLTAALLQQGLFREAYQEAEKVIDFCKEVASALTHPGAQNAPPVDSDDEDDGAEGSGGGDDSMVRMRQEAAAVLREKSGHVYYLLKAYVRSAAALCGLKKYREALEFFELALKISPYDDDLRDDANRVLEKGRFNTLVSSASMSSSGGGRGGGGGDVAAKGAAAA